MAPTKSSPKGLEETSTPFGPPFDDADADTILRSSDRVDFYVYRVILSKSSSFFKSMFSLPQPDASISEKQHPVIKLTETSRIVAALLTFIYPVESVATEPESLDDMIDDFVAARKYDMAFVSQRLIQKFAESKVVQDSPVEAFCVMYSHELGEAARLAAKASLKHRMNLDIIGDKLPYINGAALHQLWKFHRACSATAAKAISDTHLTWITTSERTWWDFAYTSSSCIQKPGQKSGCLKYDYVVGIRNGNGRLTSWDATAPWHNYITRAHNVLLEHPCREAVAHDSVLNPSYEEKTCHICRCTLIGLPEFIRLLGDEIERRVSEVRHFLAYFLDTSHLMAPTEG